MTATTLVRRTAATLAVASVLGLAACSGDGGGMELNKQTVGAVLGGIGGAVIGSQFGKGTGQIVGVAAGTLLGAFLGSEVGKSLDRADNDPVRFWTSVVTAVWAAAPGIGGSALPLLT